ncbi:MAG: hypothetical protein E3K37_10810 [Candidatus Kuenenia sp.]|nr:hypothetical protein [Candidatus Kuenenia hertensis]
MKIRTNQQKEKIDILALDEGFPDRVFRMSFYLSLIIIVCSLSYMSTKLTISVATGCFISLLLFQMSWWGIRYGVQKKRPQIKGFFLQFSMIKYFIVGGILFSACVFLELNVIAMFAGLSIVLAVIILKVLGNVLVGQLNKTVKFPSENSKC